MFQFPCVSKCNKCMAHVLSPRISIIRFHFWRADWIMLFRPLGYLIDIILLSDSLSISGCASRQRVVIALPTYRRVMSANLCRKGIFVENDLIALLNASWNFQKNSQYILVLRNIPWYVRRQVYSSVEGSHSPGRFCAAQPTILA